MNKPQIIAALIAAGITADDTMTTAQLKALAAEHNVDISKDATAPETPAPAPELVLKVKVIKGGLKAGGGTAAAGTTLRLFKSAAEFHAERGEVQIIGTD